MVREADYFSVKCNNQYKPIGFTKCVKPCMLKWIGPVFDYDLWSKMTILLFGLFGVYDILAVEVHNCVTIKAPIL